MIKIKLENSKINGVSVRGDSEGGFIVICIKCNNEFKVLSINDYILCCPECKNRS